MKKMKRIVAGVLALGMAFALTACGGKEQSVTYFMEQEESGIKISDTMTLEAKGDKVQKMKETIVVDTATFDDAMKEQINQMYDALVEQYKSVEGVECTGTAADDSYTIDLVVDTTGDAVKELSSMGLLQVEGSTDGISLKKTEELLTQNGYEKK